MFDLKSLYYSISRLIPIRLVQKISPFSLYLPYQHVVSDQTKPYIYNLYNFKNPVQFRKDVDYLLKHFKPVSIEDVVSFADGGKDIPRNSFLLTFDDGLKEIYSVIAPILYEKGIPSVFFLSPELLDNKKIFTDFKIGMIIDEIKNNPNAFSIVSEHLKIISHNGYSNKKEVYLKLMDFSFKTEKEQCQLDQIAEDLGIDFQSYFQKERPFLTTEEAHELARQGFSLGGHTFNHKYLQILSPEKQVAEIIESTTDIAEKFEQKYKLFAFPYTDKLIPGRVLRESLKSGIDLLFGVQHQFPEWENRILHRFSNELPSFPLQKSLKGEAIYAAINRFLKRDKIKRPSHATGI